MKFLRNLRPIRSILTVGVTAILASLFLIGCNSSGRGGTLTPLNNLLTRAFFPLNTGDTRVYRQTNGAGATITITQTVEAPQMVQGLSMIPLTTRQANGNIIRTDYQYLGDPAGVAWGGSDEGASTLRLTPPILIPVNLAPGQVVQQTVSAVGTGSFSAVKSLATTIRMIGLTTVTTPAGTFEQSTQLEAETIFRDASGEILTQRTATTFLAPQIGIIKVISSLGTTNELTSATVAGETIP